MICICGTAFDIVARGGEPRRHCSRVCRDRAWREANPNYLREYYAARREVAVAYAREYRATHGDAIAAAARARRLANPEKERESSARFNVTHREWKKAYNRAYREANRDTIARNAAINQRKWLAANPGKGSAYMNARRAMKAGNGGSHTLAEWHDKCASYAGTCAYCGERKKLTRDHIIPLSRGGTDDISNIVPACRPCNSSKNTRTAAEFALLAKA